MTPVKLVALANQIAKRLEGYSDAVVSLDDLVGEAIETRADELPLLKLIDARVFLCKSCGYWFTQVYNATPNAQEWECKECFNER